MEGYHDLFERFENWDSSGALNHEIRMRVNIKQINNLLTKDSGSKSRTMLEDSSVVEIGAPFGDHHLGQYNKCEELRRVWVEWRSYRRHGADENVMGKLYNRVARIAELLSQEKPEAFRTLKCNGFFHDPERAAFGLIFEIAQCEEPTTLHRLIEPIDRAKSLVDLDDRFRLASTLAASLLELHTVGWLHKNLTTPNSPPRRQVMRRVSISGSHSSSASTIAVLTDHWPSLQE